MDEHHTGTDSQGKDWKILIVDASEKTFQIARGMLDQATSCHFEVEWAAGFAEGQQRLETRFYHAVLIAEQLGDHAGLELVRAAARRDYPSPLILLTGSDSRAGEAIPEGAALALAYDELNPRLLARALRYLIETKHKEQARNQREGEALRLSEEKFARAFRASPVAIAISTVEEGRFIEVNDSYTALFGFDRQELIGHTSIELGMFPDPEKRHEITRLFRAGNGFRSLEVSLRAKTGQMLDVLFSTERVEVNGQDCMLSLVVDITERKRAEQTVRESEDRLREFLESTHDSFFILDRDWRFRYINRRASEILSARAEDLLGQRYWDVFPRYLGTSIEAHYRKAMEERAPVHYEHGGIYSPYIYQVSVYPSRDGIAVFAVDRSEEKKTQETLRKLSEAVKQSPASVVITDLTGKIEYVNPKFTQLTGYTLEEALGQNPRILKSGLTPPEVYQQMWRTLRAGQPWQGEFANRKKNGDLYWEAVSISPITGEDGQITHFVAVKEDITEQKQAEEALAESARQLERSNRELQEFAFVASHDLQEPLRKIRLFGDRLLDLLKDDCPPDARDYLQRMQNAAMRMQGMINGLLALSRVSTRGGDFAPVNLQEVAEEVVSDLEVRLHSSGGQVLVENLPVIEADELQIRQLFQNLIGNALKFHKSDTPPVIRVTGAVTDGARPPMLTLRFEDNGIGFDPQYAERIFQPFQRLHTRGEYEGNGLGLSICQKIVERHQGKIEVTSAPGEGAVFSVTLPVSHAHGGD